MGRPSVLVVEDEPLLAWDLCDQLREAGFSVAGPVATAPKALDLLKRVECDAAILDVNLGDHTSAPVAEKLAASAIPFVTVTGYARPQIEAVFQASPLVSKPLSFAKLLAALNRVTGRPDRG